MSTQSTPGTRLARWLVIVMGCTAAVAAQVPSSDSATEAPRDAAGVRALMDGGEALLREDKNAAGRALLERARDGARALGLQPEEARSLCGIAEALRGEAKYGEAEDAARQCLEVYTQLGQDRGIGWAYQIMSSASEWMGRSAQAVDQITRAIDAFEAAREPVFRVRARFHLLSLLKDGDVNAPDHDELLAEARALGDRGLEGRLLHAYGDFLFNSGRYDQSLDALTQAAEALNETGDLGSIGTVYNSLGRLYRAHGNLDEALGAQRKALAIHRTSGQPLVLIQSLNAVASVHLSRDEPRQARRYFAEAMTLAERTKSQRVIDFLLGNITTLQLRQGRYADAAAALRQIVSRGVDQFPAQRNSQLAFAYLKLGQPTRALASATRALETCEANADACIDALGIRAAVYAAQRNYPAARADIDRALRLIEDTRRNLVPSDFLKQDFHKRQEGIYSQAIALQFQQRQRTDALETAELARSRAFLDLLATRQADLGSPGPKAPSPPPAGAAGSAGALDIASSDQRLELRSAAAATPARIADIAAVAGRLRSTVVLYWVGNQELFIWAVGPRGLLASRRVAVSATRVAELVRSTLPLAPSPEQPARPGSTVVATRGVGGLAVPRQAGNVWQQLYGLLIHPVRGVLPRETGALLTIVPHGVLTNISFAALQDESGRLLIRDYTTHYASAGAMLQLTGSARRPDGRQANLLLIADPNLTRRSKLDPALPPLPGARTEVRAISRLVPQDRVTALEGRVATEAALRQALPNKGVLHFATHAIVRDNEPASSYLALGRSGDGGDADGWLTARDVYGLRLDVDLVVLSACRSGGAALNGDGIATFARAFIYAGSPSLIVSLADVADEPTNRMMPEFYRRWLGGASKARSLRQAQLALLRDLEAGRVKVSTPAGHVTVPPDAMFWAPFVLIGEPN